jgi:hypothetical protein
LVPSAAVRMERTGPLGSLEEAAWNNSEGHSLSQTWYLAWLILASLVRVQGKKKKKGFSDRAGG